MRHYIYLEDRRIIYACGMQLFSRVSGTPGALRAEAQGRESKDAAPDAAFKRLADRHGLAGKSVTLILGSDLSFLGMTLPKGRGSVVRRMAMNQLAAVEGLTEEQAAVVDFRYCRRENVILAALFHMKERRLTAYKSAMSAAGMSCSRVLAVPECMALAAQALWKERSHLLVNVEREQLGLYLVSKGHCLAFAITPLKALRFYRKDGEELLYEEIAEQAELLFARAAVYERNTDIRPECGVLLGGCLPNPDQIAAALELLLKLPCSVRTLGAERREDRSYKNLVLPSGFLAACMADRFTGRLRPSNVIGRSSLGVSCIQGVHGIFSRGWTIFLLVNGAAALSAGICAGGADRAAKREFEELRTELADSRYRREYSEAVDREEALVQSAAGDAAYKSAEEYTAGKNLLGMNVFRAFTDSMEPDMEVESVVFEGDKGVLAMTISMSGRRQIPLYVERVKNTGVFGHVSHSLWEQKGGEGKPERFWVTVSASLPEGGRDEAQ